MILQWKYLSLDLDVLLVFVVVILLEVEGVVRLSTTGGVANGNWTITGISK